MNKVTTVTNFLPKTLQARKINVTEPVNNANNISEKKCNKYFLTDVYKQRPFLVVTSLPFNIGAGFSDFNFVTSSLPGKFFVTTPASLYLLII